ncbi:hypothetical protein ES705_28993 [subsurface metagenome]
MKVDKVIEVLYHASVIGFVSGMVITLVTFRPIEPNVIIATVEVVIGLVTLGCAVVKIGRAIV